MEDLKIGGVFVIGRRLGKGSFGTAYVVSNTKTKQQFAAKLEDANTKVSRLRHEVKLLRTLGVGTGIPRVYYSGTDGDYNVMVMDLLGASLEELFASCARSFSRKTILMIADQMLQRLAYIHSMGVIHRDLKPENILLGRGQPVLHLIDFGCARRYIDARTNRHIRYSDRRKLTGTVRYASINAHAGVEQSRRDDLESLGYLLAYLTMGRLPWQGAEGSREEKDRQIYEKKKQFLIEGVGIRLPQELAGYLEYCRALEFEEEPDYGHACGIFKEAFVSAGLKDDKIFDWMSMRRVKSSGAIAALPAIPATPQVQHVRAASSGSATPLRRNGGQHRESCRESGIIDADVHAEARSKLGSGRSRLNFVTEDANFAPQAPQSIL